MLLLIRYISYITKSRNTSMSTDAQCNALSEIIMKLELLVPEFRAKNSNDYRVLKQQIF